MYAIAASTLFQSCRDYSEGFSAALDFALSADEIFDLYNNAPCGYHSLAANGLFLRVNNTELKWLGYTRDEVVGRLRFQDLIDPAHRDDYYRDTTALARNGVPHNTELRLRHKDGTPLDVSVETTAIHSDRGELVYTRARLSDISARKRSESGLRDQERFIDRVLMATSDVVSVVNVETRRSIFANREAATQLGYAPDEIASMGEDFFERLVHPDDLPRIAAHIIRILRADDDAVLTTEYRLRRADGTYRVFASRDTVFARDASGTVMQYLGVAHDVTEQRTAQSAIEEQEVRLKDFALQIALQRSELKNANRDFDTLATTDGLTGLPNHGMFQECLHREFALARGNDSPLSLLLLDLDHFKPYNDSFGHPAGDVVLRVVGRILQEMGREGDICARYGGEEFAMILPGTGKEDALLLAEQLRRAIEVVRDPNRAITTCVGVASLNPETTAPSEMIRDADAAIYQAKRAGRNQVVYIKSRGF